MSNNEKYYFTFKFVDGSTQEFKLDDERLSGAIKNSERSRIQVGNNIINMDNVLLVTIETASEREQEK